MIVPKHYLSELDCANFLGKPMFDYPRIWDSPQAIGINVHVFAKETSFDQSCNDIIAAFVPCHYLEIFAPFV